ncbi:hypothetical protein MPOCJGCO_3125 [Methylobacterium trifolii]|uniref:Uncharacterized protein n=1 Tax=Methylobacterium trifolii TaxID=1003092 RepID=A0ABQ4U0N1_9HYPH|nr:hypothetical protein MPOCJGCO_3125 [Methylobacterium trifolii]
MCSDVMRSLREVEPVGTGPHRTLDRRRDGDLFDPHFPRRRSAAPVASPSTAAAFYTPHFPTHQARAEEV